MPPRLEKDSSIAVHSLTGEPMGANQEVLSAYACKQPPSLFYSYSEA